MLNKVCYITFAEKVRIFSYDYLKCCSYIARSDAKRYLFTKKLFSKLVSTSQLLEDFLDFHGAKNSKRWYLYRELSAAIRHLSISSYSQRHISNRLVFYNLPDTDEFEKEGNKNIDFFIKCIVNVAPVVLEEARRLRIPVPDENFEPEDFPGITTSEMLAFDIDDQDIDQQKKNIVKIANEFINITEPFEQFEFYEQYNSKKILSLVPGRINEITIRRYEMLVHNLQSSFDTYVIQGGFRTGNRKLKKLRSFFSVVFHLLQMTGRLLHFYERHLYKTGYKNTYKMVQEKISLLIDSEILLDRTINYGIYYACHYLTKGKSLAIEILNENIERSSIKVGIPVKLGFHSRPSLLVAKIVQHYGGRVNLLVGEDRFDASSVLDIQWAGGKIQKEALSEVIFEGDVRSLEDIKILASVNYGEDIMGKGIQLPDGLKYLR